MGVLKMLFMTFLLQMGILRFKIGINSKRAELFLKSIQNHLLALHHLSSSFLFILFNQIRFSTSQPIKSVRSLPWTSTFAVKCNKHQGQDQTNVWVVSGVTWTQDRVTFHLRLHPHITITPTSPRWWHSGKQIFTTDVPLTHIHTFIIHPLTLLFTHTWSTQILSFKQSKTRKYYLFWMSEVNRKQMKLNVKDIQSKNSKFKTYTSNKEKKIKIWTERFKSDYLVQIKVTILKITVY